MQEIYTEQPLSNEENANFLILDKSAAAKNPKFFGLVERIFSQKNDELKISKDMVKIDQLVDVLSKKDPKLWTNPIFKDENLPFYALGAVFYNKISINQFNSIMVRYYAIKEYGEDAVKTLCMNNESKPGSSYEVQQYLDTYTNFIKYTKEIDAEFWKRLGEIDYSEQFMTIVKRPNNLFNCDSAFLEAFQGNRIYYMSVWNGRNEEAMVLLHTEAAELLHKLVFEKNYIAPFSKLGLVEEDDFEFYQTLGLRITDRAFPGTTSLRNPDGYENQTSTVCYIHDALVHARLIGRMDLSVRLAILFRMLPALKIVPKSVQNKYLKEARAELVDMDFSFVFKNERNNSKDATHIEKFLTHFLTFQFLHLPKNEENKDGSLLGQLLIIYDMAINKEQWKNILSQDPVTFNLQKMVHFNKLLKLIIDEYGKKPKVNLKKFSTILDILYQAIVKFNQTNINTADVAALTNAYLETLQKFQLDSYFLLAKDNDTFTRMYRDYCYKLPFFKNRETNVEETIAESTLTLYQKRVIDIINNNRDGRFMGVLSDLACFVGNLQMLPDQYANKSHLELLLDQLKTTQLWIEDFSKSTGFFIDIIAELDQLFKNEVSVTQRKT